MIENKYVVGELTKSPRVDWPWSSWFVGKLSIN